MKTNKWKLWGSVGWFSREEFKLLSITFFTKQDWDWITIFDFQIGKFAIQFGVRK